MGVGVQMFQLPHRSKGAECTPAFRVPQWDYAPLIHDDSWLPDAPRDGCLPFLSHFPSFLYSRSSLKQIIVLESLCQDPLLWEAKLRWEGTGHLTYYI